MGKKRNSTQRKKKKRAYRPRQRATRQVLEQAEEAYNKGAEALEADNYQTAEGYFKESLNAYPSADAHYALGSVYMSQEQYEKAIEPFENALKIERRNALYWYSLGAATLREGYLYRAIPAFEKAEKYDPHDDPDLTESIENHFELIDELVELQLQEHPGLDRETYLEQEERYFKAVAFQEAKQFEKALELFIEYLKIEPEFFRALGNAGVCLISLGRLDEAESFLKKALRVNPDYQFARFNLKMLKNGREIGAFSADDVTTLMVDMTKGSDFDEQMVQALYEERNLRYRENDFDVEVSDESMTHRRSYQAQSTKRSQKNSEESALRRILSLLGL